MWQSAVIMHSLERYHPKLEFYSLGREALFKSDKISLAQILFHVNHDKIPSAQILFFRGYQYHSVSTNSDQIQDIIFHRGPKNLIKDYPVQIYKLRD